MSRLKLLSLTTATILMSASGAYAQNACGRVIDMDRAGEAESYCSDIYDRQLDYRKERIKFRKAIDERREDYAAPAREAREKYAKDLADLNAQRSHENDITNR